MEPPLIEPPLAQFNHTLPTEADMKSLIHTLNDSLKEKKLRDDILTEVFDTYWPKFEKSLAEILSGHPETLPQPAMRSDENILLELLETTRSFDRRIRNIESSVKNKEAMSTQISPMGARRRIHDYIKNGVPKELIIDKLTSQGFPLSFIEREVMRILEENIEENN